MIKAILIDDEPLACALMQEMLSAYADIEVVAICNDGLEGLKQIQNLQPDVVFLDIQMPKITGIEMLELIPDPPRIIFSTAYDDYAIKAFELNALDYLLKPFSEKRLHQAIDKLKNDLNRQTDKPDYSSIATPESSNRIVVKDNNTIKIIPIQDVLFIEAVSDYVKIHKQDKYYLKHGTMQHYENILTNQNFIRVHRSYIVNSEYIHKVELNETGGNYLTLKNQQVIPVSKSGYSRLKNFLA